VALSVLITTADGAVHRCGPDEPDPAWIPEGTTYDSAIPGGWRTCTFNLRRRIDEDIPLRLRDEVEVVDGDGATMWEGRIAALPRQHGDDYLAGVQCVGWAAHLKDDDSFREVYVDRDLSRWRGPSIARQIEMVATSALGSSQVTRDASGSGALELSFKAPWGPRLPNAEAWYHASGIPIRTVYALFNSNPNAPGGNASFRLTTSAVSGDNAAAGFETVDDLWAAGGVPNPGYATASIARKWWLLAWFYAVQPITGDADYTVWLRNLAVYGDHGLTRRGPDPGGFYIDDILANLLRRGAPKLNFTVGEGGSIGRPDLVVAQAAYPEPGPVENVILDLNKYVLWEWGCYDRRTFFYRPSDPTRLTWEARLDQGAHLNLEGDDDERTINGVIVTYHLPDGTSRVAGPPGSGFHIEHTALVDPDPANTATAHGYARAWKRLDITFPTVDDNAVAIGSAYLAETSLPSRSGDITLTGGIEHPTKGMRPVRELRAGDWIRLSDHPTDVPRRIIQPTHRDDQRQTTVTVGNDIKKVDALLEQLGVLTSLV